MMTTRLTELPAPGDGLGPNPKITITVQGTHDVGRIVHLLSKGLTEHVILAADLVRKMRQHPSGLAALKLLALHGGTDFTKEYPGGIEPEDWTGE